MDNNIIEITGLDKSFDDIKVLKSLELKIKRGAIISVIGRSGCGKSTLLKCINLLEIPDNGQYRINDIELDFNKITPKNLWKFSRKQNRPQSAFMDAADYLNNYDQRAKILQIRRKVSLIFQSLNLFAHLNVLENVSLAPKIINGLSSAEANEIASRILAKFNMQNFEKRMPANLSGGQAQRVAIARSLAMNPDVLLFDEPTSALDPELVADLVLLMRELQSDGITQVFVTHQLNLARAVSDCIYYMDEGKLIESGTPEELFSTPKDPKTAAYISKVLLR